MPPLGSRRQWAVLPSSREVEQVGQPVRTPGMPDDRGRWWVSAPGRAERPDSRAHAVAPHALVNTEKAARGRRAMAPPWPGDDRRSTVERPERGPKRTHTTRLDL